ncbi:MAG: hypothetical protein R3300_09635, partial [Candidatus Promineifilaceae bacterium]|nr:hypothetical protein [Candidatus Promineifilaceae bacterium]
AIDARATAIAAEAEANAARVTAEEQRQIAISRELASAAVANLDKDPERSVLLAMEAFNAAHTQEAEAALHEAVPNLRVLHRLEGHEDRVLSLAYNADGTRLLTGSRDGTARVWDTESGEELLQLPGHAVDITTAAYSADGTFMVTADRDASLAKVWDATTGELRHTLSGHLNNPNVAYPGEPVAVLGVAISPDSTIIATGGEDGYARL